MTGRLTHLNALLLKGIISFYMINQLKPDQMKIQV